MEDKVKSLRIIATVAFLLIIAASASEANAALPEFKVKEATTSFTFKATSPTVILTVGKQRIECTNEKEKSKGEGSVNGLFETNEIIKDMITLYGCEYNGTPCTTTVGFTSEVETLIFKGEIEYLNKATKEVGLLMNKGGGEFSNFSCETKSAKVVVKGAFTGKIEPINKYVNVTEQFTITFNQANGMQNPSNFCPKMGNKESQIMVSISNVNGGAFQEAGIEGTFKIVPQSKAEIELAA
jgi:hypothetical protein